MYKRAILILSVAMLFITPLGAKIFEVGFGPMIQFKADPFAEDTTQTTWVDGDNYQHGYEMRMRLAKIEIDAHLVRQQGKIVGQTERGTPIYLDNISSRISGAIAFGTASEIAPKTYLGYALALPMGVNFSVHEGPIFWLGDPANCYLSDNTESFQRHITFAYRFKFDVRIAHFILSATYQVPASGFSYASFNKNALAPVWSQGRLGFAFVGVLW